MRRVLGKSRTFLPHKSISSFLTSASVPFFRSSGDLPSRRVCSPWNYSEPRPHVHKLQQETTSLSCVSVKHCSFPSITGTKRNAAVPRIHSSYRNQTALSTMSRDEPLCKCVKDTTGATFLSCEGILKVRLLISTMQTSLFMLNCVQANPAIRCVLFGPNRIVWLLIKVPLSQVSSFHPF